MKWNYISLRLLHSILAVSHFKEKGGNYCCCSASERERERDRGDSDISDIIYDEFRTWIALHGPELVSVPMHEGTERGGCLWGLLYFFVAAAAAVCGNRRIKTLEKISEKNVALLFFLSHREKERKFFFRFLL